MRRRTLATALLAVVLTGFLGVVIALDPGGASAPADPARWSLWTTAHAQGLGTPLRYSVVPERSEARYRVREQLAGVSFPNDAVGTTSVIEGRITLDTQGRVVADDSRFSVDLRALKSNEARRDNYIQRNTLETDRYPTVVFMPTEVRGLPVPLPRTGTVPFELVGDLTVRDTTRRITWQATAAFGDQEVGVQAKTAFRFEDFGLRTPRVAVVLSVEDDIRLETDIVLRRGS